MWLGMTLKHRIFSEMEKTYFICLSFSFFLPQMQYSHYTGKIEDGKLDGVLDFSKPYKAAVDKIFPICQHLYMQRKDDCPFFSPTWFSEALLGSQISQYRWQVQ